MGEKGQILIVNRQKNEYPLEYDRFDVPLAVKNSIGPSALVHTHILSII